MAQLEASQEPPAFDRPQRSGGQAVSARALARVGLFTMGWPAAAAVSLALAITWPLSDPAGLALVAAGTMAAYGLDRLIDRRDRDPAPVRRFLRVCVVGSALVTAVLACTAWWRVEVCALLAVMAGAYVPLKRFIPKNLLTTAAWTLAAATLPLTARPVWDATFTGAVVAAALVMAANTVICDLPDFAADRDAGVCGITPWFGPRVGGVVAALCGATGAVVAGGVDRWGLSVAAASLAVLALLMMRHPQRVLLRRLADAVVTVIPGPVALLLR